LYEKWLTQLVLRPRWFSGFPTEMVTLLSCTVYKSFCSVTASFGSGLLSSSPPPPSESLSQSGLPDKSEGGVLASSIRLRASSIRAADVFGSDEVRRSDRSCEGSSGTSGVAPLRSAGVRSLFGSPFLLVRLFSEISLFPSCTTREHRPSIGRLQNVLDDNVADGGSLPLRWIPLSYL